MKETHDFSDAKVGDLVTCLMFGKGKITKIDLCDEDIPIRVDFDCGTWKWFSIDGFNTLLKRYNTNPTLYHGHVEFEINVKQPVYEWQWLYLNDHYGYTTTGFYRDELQMLTYYQNARDYKRIEESKREVK